MPEISLLSQIQLLICSPVNRYLWESDPSLDLSSSSPHLTRTLQARHSASRKASAVATPAKAVPHSAPHLPSPPPCPLRLGPKHLLPPNPSYRTPASFPQPLSLQGFCCCLAGACKHPWPSPLLCWKTSLCKLFLSMSCHLASTTYSQDGHQLLGSVRRSSCLKPPPAFTKQMILLSLCSYRGQCK